MECTYPKEFREGSFRERKFYCIAKDQIRLEKQGKAQVSPGLCDLKYSDNVLKKQKNKTCCHFRIRWFHYFLLINKKTLEPNRLKNFPILFSFNKSDVFIIRDSCKNFQKKITLIDLFSHWNYLLLLSHILL